MIDGCQYRRKCCALGAPTAKVAVRQPSQKKEVKSWM